MWRKLKKFGHGCTVALFIASFFVAEKMGEWCEPLPFPAKAVVAALYLVAFSLTLSWLSDTLKKK